MRLKQSLAPAPVHSTSARIASSLCHGSQLPHQTPVGHEDFFLVFQFLYLPSREHFHFFPMDSYNLNTVLKTNSTCFNF